MLIRVMVYCMTSKRDMLFENNVMIFTMKISDFDVRNINLEKSYFSSFFMMKNKI